DPHAHFPGFAVVFVAGYVFRFVSDFSLGLVDFSLRFVDGFIDFAFSFVRRRCRLLLRQGQTGTSNEKRSDEKETPELYAHSSSFGSAHVRHPRGCQGKRTTQFTRLDGWSGWDQYLRNLSPANLLTMLLSDPAFSIQHSAFSPHALSPARGAFRAWIRLKWLNADC